jgi:hypothetical protein
MRKEHDLKCSIFLNPTFILLLTMTLFMTCVSYESRDPLFQLDSESLVVSMIMAAKYDIGINGKYGLGRIWSLSDGSVLNAYDVYKNGINVESIVSGYASQIGLQGWIFYTLSKCKIPHLLGLMRIGCCLLLSLIIAFICYELYIKYGVLLATSFYLVSICSAWIRNFSTNLYWVEFTWFIPMLLGLICLNNLNKRFWLYPLFFLAILVKCACGYEYITVIMLSSIMFLVVEWFCSIKNKRQSKLVFSTIICIGIFSLLGFVVTFLIHSSLRGNGSIFYGFKLIYQNDVLRRTFGNAGDFPEVYTTSLNASIFDVFLLYFKTPTGIIALFLCLAFLIALINNKKRVFLLRKDICLFLLAFITCISWFIFGKAHSYLHTHMNYVMWYMGFIQIGTYFVLKYVLKIFNEKVFTLEKVVHKLQEEIIKD